VLVDNYYDEALKDVFTDVSSMMINSDAMDLMINALNDLYILDVMPSTIPGGQSPTVVLDQST
jgi:hypothetical protein